MLICDLAETYGILDYRKLPVKLVASLASGLRADSRLFMELSGLVVPTNVSFFANIMDQLNILIWMQTKDGTKNRNRPKPVLFDLNNDNDTTSFTSVEEFEQARQEIVNGGDK